MSTNTEILEAVVKITTLINILGLKHLDQTERLRELMLALNALEDGLNATIDTP